MIWSGASCPDSFSMSVLSSTSPGPVLCASESAEGLFLSQESLYLTCCARRLAGRHGQRTRTPCCLQVYLWSPAPPYRILRLYVRQVTASRVPAEGNLRSTRQVSIHSNLTRRFPLAVLLGLPLRAWHRTDDGSECNFKRLQTLDLTKGFQFRLACVCLHGALVPTSTSLLCP